MLDFSVTDFKLSHGFYSKNGLINGHIGSYFYFFMWPFLLCVGLELFFLVISICTELFCFGGGIGITCS